MNRVLIDSFAINLKSAFRNLKFAILHCTLLFALCASAEAQQPTKVPRIGYLSSTNSARESARFEAIRLALRELGYIEGQNIATEYRYAEGKQDRNAPSSRLSWRVSRLMSSWWQEGTRRSGRRSMRPRRFPS